MKWLRRRSDDAPTRSLLMAGAGQRIAGALAMIAVLWLAVAWAIGAPQ